MNCSIIVARTYLGRCGPLVIAAMIIASCTTNRTDTTPPEPAAQPLTQSKAAEQCWMETEHGQKSLPLDKRSKLVDKCVKDKMDAARATSADSK
jgi:hypothetical protein